jgi:DNA-binding response OmpR family regulator
MSNNSRARILVVEDSLAAAKRLQFSFQQAGFKVDVARNGREALAKARQRKFDLVVTDEQMPEMTGREWCQELRNDERYADTPIIFLTAKQFEIDAAELSDDLHVCATFGKPFSPQALVRKVEAELLAARRVKA